MTTSLKPEHLKRYRDIARLVLKYGRSDLLPASGLEEVAEEEAPAAADVTSRADELARDLEQLGPTYVKLGQLLSTRADLLPLPYVAALARLQDEVEPFAYEEVERTVHQELGVRLSKAFSEFHPEPLAAASLGQVHRAAMRDGRRVAVKVQRPGIRERIVEDLEALEEIAGFLDRRTELGRRYEFTGMVDEFRKTVMRELDYRQEARNLTVLGENLKEFERIVIPRPVEDYTTSRVLTMEYVPGRKITAVGPLGRLEMDGAPLADQLFRAYLKQILVDGFFHADPHPGNVFLTDDGRLALLDVGMAARIAPEMQERLLKMLLAVSEGRSEEAAELALEIGEVADGFDEAKFRRDVADLVIEHQDVTVGQIDVGRVMLEMTRASGENGVRAPRELTLLGKALLNLDHVGRTLDPDFDPNAAIRRHAAEIMRKRLRTAISPGSLFAGVMELNEFVQRLPGRINKILDAVASNELELKVDTIDERTLVEGFQKVANRVALGLVLAALIVGAAMLMNVETTFRIFGYPGLAMLCFIAAAGGGFALIVNILLHDQRIRRDQPAPHKSRPR